MKTEWNKTLAGSFKGMWMKVAAAGVLAGAVLFAAPEKAAAQGFSFQVGVGRHYYGPVYRGPVYGPPVYGSGYYAELRHDEWLRHERWVREHEFHGAQPVYRGYGW